MSIPIVFGTLKLACLFWDKKPNNLQNFSIILLLMVFQIILIFLNYEASVASTETKRITHSCI